MAYLNTAGFQRCIQPYNVSFPDKQIETFAEGNALITRAVSYGMPRIDDQYLQSTFYLYGSVEDAQRGSKAGGTGFVIGHPFSADGGPPKAAHLYIVTNLHVLRDGYPVIRLHRKDGTQRIVETDPADWTFKPDINDVAVNAISLSEETDRFAYIPTDMFVGRDEVDIGIGDDVFMIGRFREHDGGEENMPSLRFGNISMMPQVIDGKESYTLDMHSRTGFSGSPVFVYRMPGGDFRKGKKTNLGRMLKFLGIHWGQFPEELELRDETIRGFSGMTCVAPAWAIMDVLNMPELKQARIHMGEVMREDQRDKPLSPVEESSDAAEAIRDTALKRMLNTPPKPRK